MYWSENSLGVSIFVWLNLSSLSKCLSPVTMKSALACRAHSSILLSSVSSFMVWSFVFGLTRVVFVVMCCRMSFGVMSVALKI